MELEFNTPFNLAQQAKSMTIADVEHTANELAKEFGENAREEYLSRLFDGLHQV